MTRTLLLNRWRRSGHIEGPRRGSPRAIAVYIKGTRGDELARRRKRDKKLEYERKKKKYAEVEAPRRRVWANSWPNDA